MYYRDELPVNLEEYLKLLNEVYSDIIERIIDDYMAALEKEYEALYTEKVVLEETYKKLTPSLEEFNQIMISKGIQAEIKYSNIITRGGKYSVSLISIPFSIPYCIMFNNLIQIPIKEEYDEMVDTGVLEFNPKRAIEKIALLIKLDNMKDYEKELLLKAIKEEEDTTTIRIEISKAEGRIDNYYNKYFNNKNYNIDKSIMTDVIKNLYEEGIITDEFLSSTTSKKKKSSNEKLSQLIKFLSENIYYIDYYLSKRGLRIISLVEERKRISL